MPKLFSDNMSDCWRGSNVDTTSTVNEILQQ